MFKGHGKMSTEKPKIDPGTRSKLDARQDLWMKVGVLLPRRTVVAAKSTTRGSRFTGVF
jgi:hypothetical protein